MPDASPSAVSDAELDAQVRRAVLRGVVGLGMVFLVLGLCGVFFEAELLAATAWVYTRVGLVGLCAINFASDALVTPVSPDFALLIISRSPLREHWLWLVPSLGLWSALAGVTGFTLARHLGRTRAPALVLGKLRERNEALVKRYGAWAIALGALTPLPFSVTCWSAGLLNMPLRTVAVLTLLRVPRFVLYYVAIAYADSLLRLFLGAAP